MTHSYRPVAVMLVALLTVPTGAFAQETEAAMVQRVATTGLAGGHRVNYPLRDAALREVMRINEEQAQQASPSQPKWSPVKIGAGIGLLLGAAVVTPVMCDSWGGCAGEGVHPGVAVALFGGIGAGIGAAIGYVVSRR